MVETIFDDLKANTFVQVEIIGDARLETLYAYVYKVDEVRRNYLHVSELKTINSAISNFVML